MKPKRKNIILTGFMCTGKTTVGKKLAREMGYEFVDTDELIMSRSGETIERIFAEKGEAAFREMEAGLARELARREGLVVSTGGGMMLDPGNAEALEKTGRVFCLWATPEEIVRRCSGDTSVERPLLNVPDPVKKIEELLQQRKKVYDRFNQVKTTGKTADDLAETLAGMVRSERQQK